MVQRCNIPIRPIPRNRGDGLTIGDAQHSGKSMVSCLEIDDITQWQNTPRPGTLEYIHAQAVDKRSACDKEKRDYIQENIRRSRCWDSASASRNSRGRSSHLLPSGYHRTSSFQRYLSDLVNQEQVDECVGISDYDDTRVFTEQTAQSAKDDSTNTLPVGQEQHTERTQLIPSPVRFPVKHSLFLKAHEKSGLSIQDLFSLSKAPLKPIGKRSNCPLSVPRASSARDVSLVRRNVDFVRANANAISCSNLNRTPKESLSKINSNCSRPPTGSQRTLKLGEIPYYLIKRRQQETEAEVIRKAAEENQVPAGHRQIDEEERQHTLFILQRSYIEAMDELGHLPIHLDTFRIRSRRANLEDKLVELESAIAVFIKPTVYVKMDSPNTSTHPRSH